MKLLVTGATGDLGTKIVTSLLNRVPANQLVVSVRNVEKANKFQERGVEVRQGDFDHPETLDSAFSGIDRLLIISTDGDNETRTKQHKNAVAAAERAQVKFIAYTSIVNAQKSKNLFASTHQATEEAILKTGIPYSFLRNNWYLENEISNIQAVLAGGPWVTSAGTGKVGWALKQDYAEAAAAVLSGHGHEKTVYELSGKLMTQDELASVVGEVLGKEVSVQQVEDDVYTDIVKKAGVPDFLIPMLVGIQKSIRENTLEVESKDFEKLLGHPVTPIKEAVAQIVKQISSKN
ncbi:SDR family oxidoreductase [Sporolactobacillus kofuensis]|uniref:SDR family oxidoreductase n=1 Tax=Sporolactobacillus kofuensis TaxID=269672 RepID=A0ABW1WCP9_9BACL|nr:SDR family oxidoreductase [Sporolactobacillus kofuensis]MCO7175222.1 SDR family oxidoreductase [Sporolactobacillus kofuensis]